MANEVNGIDVSHYQGDIDWVQVKNSGITYGIAKATDGATGQDSNFSTNWQNMLSAGIKSSAYHYFRGSSSTPQDQANNIIQQLTAVNFDSEVNSLAIDVESSGNESVSPDMMADNLHQLLNILVTDSLLNNSFPYIYCSPDYWEQNVNWEKYDFSIYPLWIAQWDVSEPTVPTTWQNKGWLWWQKSSTGSVPGITGDVDLDVVKVLC
jgi:lysozyme